jgi:hypothetical protein
MASRSVSIPRCSRAFYEAGADAGHAADRICATLRDRAGQSTGQHFVAPKDRGDLLGPRC